MHERVILAPEVRGGFGPAAESSAAQSESHLTTVCLKSQKGSGMKSRERSIPERVGSGMRVLVGQWQSALLQNPTPASATTPAPHAVAPAVEQEVSLEFHRRMFAIITTVQESVWERGVRQLLGYATDYGLGQARGVQTLVLKTRGRSAYIRLQWDTIMSDAEESRRQVAVAVQAAIGELT